MLISGAMFYICQFLGYLFITHINHKPESTYSRFLIIYSSHWQTLDF